MARPVFRFAPSPNGKLHLGHAFSALLNLKLARQCNGKSLLRIENIDQNRCTPDLETEMLRDLEWIGFEWDEPPRRQSEHFGEYNAALSRLDEMGLVFPSVLTRGEIRRLVSEKQAAGHEWPHDPDGSPLYPGTEHLLGDEEKKQILQSDAAYSLRLDLEQVSGLENITWKEGKAGIVDANPAKWGKPVLARKDTPASYHLCCVVDDSIQGISHIVRGADLYETTSLHRVLQNLLDLPEPEYLHHRLVLEEDGTKLSKSRHDTSLADLRASGYSPADIKDLLDERGLFENPFYTARQEKERTRNA